MGDNMVNSLIMLNFKAISSVSHKVRHGLCVKDLL